MVVAAGDRRPVWERLSRQEAVAGGVDPVEEGAETAAIAAGMAFAAAVEGAAQAKEEDTMAGCMAVVVEAAPIVEGAGSAVAGGAPGVAGALSGGATAGMSLGLGERHKK